MSTVRIEDGVPHVGERAYPDVTRVDNKDTRAGSHEWRERRFRLPFDNGWMLSVIWGSGTYSDNHHVGLGDDEWHEAAATVEVAAWPAAGGMVEWDDGDTVKGWVSADDLNRLIDSMPSWPSEWPAGMVASIDGPKQRVRHD